MGRKGKIEKRSGSMKIFSRKLEITGAVENFESQQIHKTKTKTT